MYSSSTVFTKVLQINDHIIFCHHIEEVQVDGDKVLIHMVSGRKITLDCTNYDKAKAFAENILINMGFKK